MTISLKAESTGNIGKVINNAIDAIVIDAAGKVSFPQNAAPAFQAIISVSQTINATLQNIVFGQEEFDTDNAFDGTAFSPTVPGYYWLEASIQVLQTGGGVQINIEKNALGAFATGFQEGTNQVVRVSTLMYFNGTSDFAYVTATSTVSGAVPAPSRVTQFNGFLARRA